MTTLAQPVDPTNPIVFLDIQIGLENGKDGGFFHTKINESYQMYLVTHVFFFFAHI